MILTSRQSSTSTVFGQLPGYTLEEIEAMGSSLAPRIFHPEDLVLISAHHEAMKEAKDFEDGQAADIVYSNVNQAFETLTDLKDVIGKKSARLFPASAKPHLN